MRFIKVEQKYRGGQGEVWLGRRESDGVDVALKYLHDNPASSDPESDRRRFMREIRCQTNLQHPNIVPIIGSNSTATPPWYVMPWAERSLRKELEQAGTPLDEEEAVDIFRDILSAIDYAHDEGVLHRDLKPENILYIDGRWCVSDFGLSRLLGSDSTTLTMTNAVLGTVAYSPPEQFGNAHAADARADVYSLGKILYEMLAGRVPFPSVDLSLVPARYRHVITRCIADDPDERYGSVSELLRQIETLVETPAALTPPLQRAQALLDDANSDNNALAEIDRILMEHDDDDVLYNKFVPYLSASLIKRLYARHRANFIRVLRTFDDLVSGSMPFSYTDTVADFMERVFEVCGDDESIRRLALRRVLTIGYDHHRYHVRDVFVRLVHARTDEGHVMMVAELLRDSPDAADFVAMHLRSTSLPEVIRRALP